MVLLSIVTLGALPVIVVCKSFWKGTEPLILNRLARQFSHMRNTVPSMLPMVLMHRRLDICLICLVCLLCRFLLSLLFVTWQLSIA